MSNEAATPDIRQPPRRAGRVLQGGLAAFAATTGALLTFSRIRGGAFDPFAAVGRRVARDVVLSTPVDVVVGLVVHLGQSLALGAIVVILVDLGPPFSRMRSALMVVLGWQLLALLPWFAVIRVDMWVQLTPIARGGLAALVVAALAFAISPARAPSVVTYR